MAMDTGAILTTKEAETILRRLDTITRRTNERQIREQCRMASCTIKKGQRRGERYREKEAELLNQLELALK